MVTLLENFVHRPGDIYIVTGRLLGGTAIQLKFTHPFLPMNMNLHAGSVWQVRGNSWVLLKRVFTRVD